MALKRISTATVVLVEKDVDWGKKKKSKLILKEEIDWRYHFLLPLDVGRPVCLVFSKSFYPDSMIVLPLGWRETCSLMRFFFFFDNQKKNKQTRKCLHQSATKRNSDTITRKVRCLYWITHSFKFVNFVLIYKIYEYIHRQDKSKFCHFA